MLRPCYGAVLKKKRKKKNKEEKGVRGKNPSRFRPRVWLRLFVASRFAPIRTKSAAPG